MKKDDIIKPNAVSELVLCKDDFDEDFNLVIGRTIEMLMRIGYTVVAYYDDIAMGVVVLQYSYRDESFGCPQNIWIDPDALETLIEMEDNRDEPFSD